MRRSTINRVIKMMLTMFGIWPRASYDIIIRAYWITMLMSDEIWMCRYCITHRQSFSDVVDSFSTFLAHIKVISRLLIFWLNQRKFVKVLSLMVEDWNDCARSDDDMRETVYKAKLAHRIANVMFALHALTIVMYSMGAFLTDVDVTDRESEVPLLMKVQLPIEIDTRRTYNLLLAAQFVHLMMIACGTGLINALLLILILHVGGQMDILCSWLSGIVSKDDERMREPISTVMSKIVRKHQKIIIFAKCVEDLYTYVAFVAFATNTVLICLLGFLIVTAIDGPNAVEQIGRSLLFYTITNLEAFIFCYAGEYLKNKSEAVGNAAYNSAWYKLKSEESRPLMFVILRAQKNLVLTVGKMMELSLESFTNIMKISGSYLSVLLAMQ